MQQARCKTTFGLTLLAATLAAPVVPVTSVLAGERTAALTLDFRSPPAPGQPAALELGLAVGVPLHGVRLDIRAHGAVRLLDDAEPAPARLAAGDAHRQLVGVWIGDRGRGEVVAVVTGSDDDVPFTRTVRLYVIVDEGGVGVGTDGFALLERRRLDLLHGRGLVKPEEFDRRLRRLLVAVPAQRS